MNIPTIALRTLSALLGGGVLILSVYLSHYTFIGVATLILLGAQDEFYRLIKKKGHQPWRWMGMALGILLLWSSAMVAQSYFTLTDMLLWCAPIALIPMVWGLYDTKRKNPWTDLAYTYLALVYIAIPVSMLNAIVWYKDQYQGFLLLEIWFITWSLDIGAYISGILFGKSPLWRRLSPKKTYEGLLGGTTLALGACFAIANIDPTFSQKQWLILGLIIIIASTYGDFIESWFKRSLQLKDSGNAIPGHGGFLDRFDSLLFCTPWTVWAIYVLL